MVHSAHFLISFHPSLPPSLLLPSPSLLPSLLSSSSLPPSLPSLPPPPSLHPSPPHPSLPPSLPSSFLSLPTSLPQDIHTVYESLLQRDIKLHFLQVLTPGSVYPDRLAKRRTQSQVCPPGGSPVAQNEGTPKGGGTSPTPETDLDSSLQMVQPKKFDMEKVGLPWEAVETVHWFMYPGMLSACVSVCLSVCLSVSVDLPSLSVCLCVWLAVIPSVHPVIHLSVYPSMCQPICISTM